MIFLKILHVVLMTLCNYSGLVAPRLSLHDVWYRLTRFALFSGCAPCSTSAHRALGKKVTVPICMVLIRPGR